MASKGCVGWRKKFGGGQNEMYLLSFEGTTDMGVLERKGVINEVGTTSVETEKSRTGEISGKFLTAAKDGQFMNASHQMKNLIIIH